MPALANVGSSSVRTRAADRHCDRCRKLGPHFCAPRAARVVRVFHEVLVHTKGVWSGKPFRLQPWQRHQIIEPLFGEVEYSEEFGLWVRRYRLSWIELPRKNGKSELLAGLALVLLVADDEPGAEIYSCAGDRAQARKVYDVAERMVRLSPLLSDRLRIYKQTTRIVDERLGSFYEAIASDAAGNLGHNVHGVLFDEVLTQPDAGLWNAMRTAMGSRAQPLMVAATTAGNDPHAFVATEHAYSERVAEDPALDRRRLVLIRTAPTDRDWRDEATWRLANPALGEFLSVEALRDEAREAELSPVKLSVFRQFRLNQWVHNISRWLRLDRWDLSAGVVDELSLRGRAVYGGLDLANTQDLAALCWVFGPEEEGDSFRAIWRFWAPSERLPDLDSRTADQASVWVDRGWLTLTPGEIIDHRSILRQIDEDARTFDVRELAFDRWGMTQMMTDLGDAGLTVFPFGQGYVSMSGPSKELERLILSRQFWHGGNPVARWCASNVVVRADPAGNIKPDRERSTDKIDGIVAAVMALARATVHGPERRSVYEDRGLLIV
jgi:phage terminase large subunit-like protein